MQNDLVNNPQHYMKHCPKVMPADLLDTLPHNMAQCFKYLIRCEDKGNYNQDIAKSYWYLNRFVCDDPTYNDYLKEDENGKTIYFKTTLAGLSQLFWLCNTNPFFKYVKFDARYSNEGCEIAVPSHVLLSLFFHLKETIEKQSSDDRQLEIKFE